MAFDLPPYVLQLSVPLDDFHSAALHVKDCAGVGDSDVGVGVFATVGDRVGAGVCDGVGLVVGVVEGTLLGPSVGLRVGALLGPSVGLRVGALLGLAVGGAAAETGMPEPCREV